MFLGDYRHKKTGNIYKVTGTALNSTDDRDGQRMVIYTRGGKTFVREAGEFREKFEFHVPGRASHASLT